MTTTPVRPDSATMLERSYDFEQRDGEDNDGRNLSGYVAVFDKKTRIDSWEGRFDEKVASGAFAKTLRERTPVLQFDHGRHPMVGSIPLGAYTALREDKRGLYVEARLHDNWLVEPVREAIESGSIDGMSFRFQVIRDSWDPAPPWEMPAGSKQVPVRTLEEVKLAEGGPVVFPAYKQTSVSVRSEQFVNELLADDEARVVLARALIFGTTAERTPPAPSGDDTRDTTLDEDADRSADTSDDEPSEHQESATDATSDPQSKRARREAYARSKGLIT